MSADLFKPLTIRGINLKNRIGVSPMCQYSSVDGFANEWHLVHLGSRAVGGAAIVFTEATAVSPEGRISPDDLGIWKDEHIDFLKRITTFVQAHGSVPGIQLAHAGRKASHSSSWKGGEVLGKEANGWKTVGPSAIAFKEDEPAPLALDKAGIEKVVQDFAFAAKRALQAGFKIIEIHGAHGYLINSFLSPLSNKREDEYGGSFENRIKVLLEVVHAVRSEWLEDLPLFVRISATEWKEGGWGIDDSVALAKILRENGVDLIDCSSGGNSIGVKIPLVPMYQTPLAAQVKAEADILTAAVGLITTAEEGERIISSGKADMVFLAREMLRDPYFPLHSAKQLGVDVQWPDQYVRAKR